MSQTCCGEHRAADLDHKPEFVGPDPDDCSRCGLAVTGLGERHGYDDVRDCPNSVDRTQVNDALASLVDQFGVTLDDETLDSLTHHVSDVLDANAGKP